MIQPRTYLSGLIEESRICVQLTPKQLAHPRDATWIILKHDDLVQRFAFHFRAYRINVAPRSGPTLTILIGAPISTSTRFTYCCASSGSSSKCRQPDKFPRQPGSVS